MVQRIESSLRLENNAVHATEGWWTWSLWVTGSPDDVAGVEAVTYRLHPTFPKPVVHVTDRDTNFALTSAGWGEFAIAADAHMKDGRTIRLEHWLQLEEKGSAGSAEKRHPSVFMSYSVADSPVVLELREALENQGIDVSTADEALAPGDDWMASVEQRLQQADAVVALVSHPPSSFVVREALTALSSGRYVIPVALRGATVPDTLSTVARFELPDPSHVGSLAQQIAARVRDRVTEEETPEPRGDISTFAPRIITIKIPVDKIRDVIGPGGKMIRSIIERTGVKIDVEDDGRVNVASADEASAKKAIGLIQELTATPELNKTYLGKVQRITDFGAFVEIMPGTDGLLHVSEIANHRVKDVRDELKEGEQVLVKVINIDPTGKIRLSRKVLLKEAEGATDAAL